jgi:predicted ATPase
VKAINAFFADKQITGFDKTTAELMITTKSGNKHPIHLLSSGEKQILLILAFIARELRPGGLVLIDEPDLHLHISLCNAFVSHLKRLAAEQHGQLIMASHSPKLWERFTQAERVELGSFAEVQ